MTSSLGDGNFEIFVSNQVTQGLPSDLREAPFDSTGFSIETTQCLHPQYRTVGDNNEK